MIYSENIKSVHTWPNQWPRESRLGREKKAP